MIIFGNVLKKGLTLIPFEQHSVHQAGRLRKKQKRKLFKDSRFMFSRIVSSNSKLKTTLFELIEVLSK